MKELSSRVSQIFISHLNAFLQPSTMAYKSMHSNSYVQHNTFKIINQSIHTNDDHSALPYPFSKENKTAGNLKPWFLKKKIIFYIYSRLITKKIILDPQHSFTVSLFVGFLEKTFHRSSGTRRNISTIFLSSSLNKFLVFTEILFKLKQCKVDIVYDERRKSSFMITKQFLVMLENLKDSHFHI